MTKSRQPVVRASIRKKHLLPSDSMMIIITVIIGMESPWHEINEETRERTTSIFRRRAVKPKNDEN